MAYKLPGALAAWLAGIRGLQADRFHLVQARTIQGFRSQLAQCYMYGRTSTLREIATRKVSLNALPDTPLKFSVMRWL